MKSKELHHGSAARVELSLNARSGLEPAGLQWTFTVPSGMQIVKIEEGTAAKKAGKTLVCHEGKCLIYGWNHTTIPNGQVAVASFKFDQHVTVEKSSGSFQTYDGARARKQEVQIDSLMGVSFDGKMISITRDTE
jgi:hypothetical protein